MAYMDVILDVIWMSREYIWAKQFVLRWIWMNGWMNEWDNHNFASHEQNDGADHLLNSRGLLQYNGKPHASARDENRTCLMLQSSEHSVYLGDTSNNKITA